MPNLFVDIETAPDFTKEEYFNTKRQIDFSLSISVNSNRSQTPLIKFTLFF